MAIKCNLMAEQGKYIIYSENYLPIYFLNIKKLKSAIVKKKTI